MKTINLKQLDIKRVASGIIQNNFNKKEIPKNPFGLTNSNYIKNNYYYNFMIKLKQMYQEKKKNQI